MTPTTDQPTELSFEDGYSRLQAISNRLSEDEVPVSEMCDLFAEGKGLEQALTAFLDTQRARVESIERGEGIKAFRIRGAADAGVATARSTAAAPGLDDTPIDAGDFVVSPSVGAADDDIPF